MSIFTVHTNEGALGSPEKGLSGASQKDLDIAVIFSSERLFDFDVIVFFLLVDEIRFLSLRKIL